MNKREVTKLKGTDIIVYPLSLFHHLTSTFSMSEVSPQRFKVNVLTSLPVLSFKMRIFG